MAAASHPPTALFVSGLDLLDTKSGQLTIASLNLSRELWLKRWPCAVVFWITMAELPFLIRGAPDLWSWKSHLFEFTESRAVMGSMSPAPPNALMVDIEALTVKARETRRDELRRRLAESGDVRDGVALSRRAAWLRELAYINATMGDYAAAAQGHEEAASLGEAAGDWRGGVENLVLASSRRGQLGDWAGSGVLADRFLANALKHLPADDPVFAPVYYGVAAIKMKKGDLAGAEQDIQRGIDVIESRSPRDEQSLMYYYAARASIRALRSDLVEAHADITKSIVFGETQSSRDEFGLPPITRNARTSATLAATSRAPRPTSTKVSTGARPNPPDMIGAWRFDTPGGRSSAKIAATSRVRKRTSPRASHGQKDSLRAMSGVL